MFSIFKKVADYFKFSRSDLYWQKRYIDKGNSGLGSYGDVAIFKAKVFNNFIKEERIKSALDFGCGDGNQIDLFKVDSYFGLDISVEMIEFCKNKFKDDATKDFLIYDYKIFNNNLQADLGMSIDVIYHLVEDVIYQKYMEDLFSCSKEFVMIYSTNHDNNSIIKMPHVRHRNFSKWVNENKKEWKFYKKIKNSIPSVSKADFYIFKKESNN